MFTAKQTRLMTILNIVSDKERIDVYEAYCEIDGEMRTNGCPGSTFTEWLENRVNFELVRAKLNSTKSLTQLA
jgi:hypothetical protein